MRHNYLLCLLSGLAASVFTLFLIALIFPLNLNPSFNSALGSRSNVLPDGYSNGYSNGFSDNSSSGTLFGTPDETSSARRSSAEPAKKSSESTQLTSETSGQSLSSAEIFKKRSQSLLPEEQVGIMIYEQFNKSVVNIDTKQIRQTNFFMQEEAEGCGSGIVLNKNGYILTNYHVVEDTTEISVTLFNGMTYEAEKIGTDPNTDIAVLKIYAQKDELFPIDMGDSSELLVGQLAFAIGNPFGIERTMTRGIISNLNRTIGSPQKFREIKGVIQIDAAINPGNSGGPLLDSQGKMIGMNTAIASRVQENSGVGFAIPVNTIKRISQKLIETGEVVRGDVGIIQVSETELGLLPILIDENGAADQAGLRGGKLVVTRRRDGNLIYESSRLEKPDGGLDIIVGVNGRPIRTGEDFITQIEEHEPGETVELNILRSGEKRNLRVKLK